MRFTAVFTNKVVRNSTHRVPLVKIQQVFETIANASIRKKRIETRSRKFPAMIPRQFKKRIVCEDESRVFIENKAGRR